MPKVVKASELKLAKSVSEHIGKLLIPLEAWEAVANPDIYLDNRAGKYVRGLEMLLESAIAADDIELTRMLTLDLIRLTKLGRSKADVNIMSGGKLRDEISFKEKSPEEIEAIIRQLREE